MILNIYTIYDTASGSYGRPFFLPSDGLAIRQFGDEVNRPEETNILYKHPSDFILFKLGSFDDEKAIFDILNSPHHLARAQDMVIKND